MNNYLGDDKHLLENEDGSIRTDCWCEPEIQELDGDRYVLHRNAQGETIIAECEVDAEEGGPWKN